MRARGYGTGKRTSYNNYRFTVRDGIILLWSIVLTIATIVALHNEIIITYYYPTIRIKNDVMAYVIFGLLLFKPPDFDKYLGDIKMEQIKIKDLTFFIISRKNRQ